jgi:acetyltransferase-like isoleucine patch superfamily enzyme
MRVDQGESQACVVGAGAVMTRSTEPIGVYAGVPTRLIGRRGWEPGR